MKEKIKILFYNQDGAGVNYFRTLTPAMEIERNYSEEFYVEINPEINLNDPTIIDYLKTFDIIHYHRQLVEDNKRMLTLTKELKDAGVVVIVDIDDYWHLHKKHPLYDMSIDKKSHLQILNNLKLADYCTTTTNLFASEIKKVTGKNNVVSLFNSIDPTWMKQFQNNWKPDPDGRVRITYMAGSSHKGDVEELGGMVNLLASDLELKDKFKIIIAGWDTEGDTADVTFNLEFRDALEKKGLLNIKTIKAINKSRGNVDLIPGLSDEMKNKFRDKIFDVKQRSINSVESTYFGYETILTDHHKLITNEDYLQWLNNFERNVKYPNEGNFGRRWTEKANAYAKVLDETDIVIAPLENNVFNTMKSNLKQVECWSRKLPIVCSDIPPYNVDGKNMSNCVLIPVKKNSDREWAKQIKKLILNPDLRKQIGEGLYEDFSVKYNLAEVTKKRVELYRSVVASVIKPE